MSNRSSASKPVFPVFILLFGLVVILAAGISALMYPSKNTINLGILSAGVMISLFAFLVSPQLLKDIVTSRKTILWLNDAFLVFLIVAIGILMAHIGFRRHYRFDFTRDRLFSISDATIKIMQNLKKDVKATVFYPTGSIESQMCEDLLKEYKLKTDCFQYKMVDPYRDQLTTKAMGVKTLGMVVQSENNRKDVTDYEIFARPIGRQDIREQPKFQGEQALTSAILNVTSGSKRKIQFVVGHEEPSLSQHENDGYAWANEYLVKENFDVSEVSLTGEIASETILAMVSPKKALHDGEIQNLKKYLARRNCGLFLTIDPDTQSQEFLSFLSDAFGVIPNAEVLINPIPYANDQTIVIPNYQMHPIIKDQMEKKVAVLMQLCRGLSFEQKPNWTTTPFLLTADNVYGKRWADIQQGNINFNPASDIRGPLNVGLALEGKGEASGTRIIILADSSFASNKLIRVQGNLDLLVNSFNWLAGQEQMISIRPKIIEFPQIVINDEIKYRVLVICVIVSPLLIIIIGGAVWLTRRRV